MRYFETRGPVYPEDSYIVSREQEINDFIKRVRNGRYIVLFAPRQTGKTTFFKSVLESLTDKKLTYFPIQLDFQVCRNTTTAVFYERFHKMIIEKVEMVFQNYHNTIPDKVRQFLDTSILTDDYSMIEFLKQLRIHLNNPKIVLIIDEFDAIPDSAVSDFLYALRQIYNFGKNRSLYSVGIVGVKNITQLNYDRSVSPFNIQDEFLLPNFTLEQVQELFSQYTDETGQNISADVIEGIHKQTAGQPFLVNRFGQILTEEFNIPKTETIEHNHFIKALAQLLEEDNVNLSHLVTNVRRDKRFESYLMQIVSYDMGVRFTLRNETISELATYGVITKGEDGMCEILNPIYHYCILQTFKPLVNGLENEYLPENNTNGFQDYLTSNGEIDMLLLLNNFRDFIIRAGFRVLQVPETPKEYVGQHLLLAYLDQFVLLIGGVMYLEVPTGRGRMDIVIYHNNRTYIIETKIWDGENTYAAGKKQLVRYMKSEGQTTGYYVVFDHRKNPEPRLETDTIQEATIHSYVIPVIQDPPSTEHNAAINF